MKETKKYLQTRWDTEAGRKLLATILRLASRGMTKEISDIAGTADGKSDLRGIRTREFYDDGLISGPPTSNAGSLWEVRFNSAEFNHANFDYSELYKVTFNECQFIDCSFRKTKVRATRSFATNYQGVDFTEMDAGELAFGSFSKQKGTEYRDCDFSGAKIRRGSAYYTLFERCGFRKVFLKDIHFDGSVLSDCKFSGHLEDVRIWGPITSESEANPAPRNLVRSNPLRNVDFSECTAHGLEFKIDVDLSSVRLPSEDEHLFVWYPRRTYSRALELVKNEPWAGLKTNDGKGMSMTEFLQFLTTEELRGRETLLHILNRKMWIKGDEDDFGRRWIDLVDRCSQLEKPS